MMIVCKLPIHPHALGEDMEVPFISWLLWRVHLGTEVTAPPGAVMVTPMSPSSLHRKQSCETLSGKYEGVMKWNLYDTSHLSYVVTLDRGGPKAH